MHCLLVVTIQIDMRINEHLFCMAGWSRLYRKYTIHIIECGQQQLPDAPSCHYPAKHASPSKMCIHNYK